MSDRRPATVVFVHGWSVKSTDTYGQLPERLVSEARRDGWTLNARHVFLGKYVSFRDEVTVDDLARGFEHALRQELADLVAGRHRFACITHSTGGPVVRQWWHRFYVKRGAECPMSHLVMLAPANFGSALAQLGKGRISRLKTWFEGVEPGVGVLDWLELGSSEAWDLNRAWIQLRKDFAVTGGTFPFVLSGQSIDRKLYDHVNAYTGEPGSDGVVRLAAANLNATYLRLVQQADGDSASVLATDLVATSPTTAFKVVPGRAHSGTSMGILRSVKDDGEPHPTVTDVMRCLRVESAADYEQLTDVFAVESEAVQAKERVDVVRRRFLPDSEYLIDQFSIVIFRVRDDEGNGIGEFDLKLTAVPAGVPATYKASPDVLPSGFLQDRQRNRRHPATLTFYLNEDLLVASPEVVHPGRPGTPLRAAAPGLTALGVVVEPHLSKGFVHFVRAELAADASVIRRVLKPNQTTLVEIVMKRIVREGVMRLVRLDRRDDAKFTNDAPGPAIDPP